MANWVFAQTITPPNWNTTLKLDQNWLRGYRDVRGKNLAYCITLAKGLYNLVLSLHFTSMCYIISIWWPKKSQFFITHNRAHNAIKVLVSSLHRKLLQSNSEHNRPRLHPACIAQRKTNRSCLILQWNWPFWILRMATEMIYSTVALVGHRWWLMRRWNKCVIQLSRMV